MSLVAITLNVAITLRVMKCGVGLFVVRARSSGNVNSNAAFLTRLQTEGMVVHGVSRFSLVDATGTLTTTDETANGRVRLEFRHQGQARSVQGLTRSGRFRNPPGELDEPDSLPARGAPVAVFNAHPRRPLDSAPEANHLVTGRGTRAYQLPIDLQS